MKSTSLVFNPADARTGSMLSCLSQPSSVAMYCGHCGGPCATMPVMILVCACAAPADKAATKNNANAPRRCGNCNTDCPGECDIGVSTNDRLRRSCNLM